MTTTWSSQVQEMAALEAMAMADVKVHAL